MTAQLGDLVEKLGKTEQSVHQRCGIAAMAPIVAAVRQSSKSAKSSTDKDKEAKKRDEKDSAKVEETPLQKAVRDR